MRKRVLKVAVGGAIAGATLWGSAGAAWAFHCYNPTKPAGAGSKGTVVITPTGEEFIPSGNGRGGFATLDLTAVGGTVVDAHAVGPVDGAVGALSRMPERLVCDGQGIDDVECLSQ
jgi:hypothetical protein